MIESLIRNAKNAVLDEIAEGEINLDEIVLSNFAVSFTYSFGLGGIDDTITIDTFLERKND